MKKPITLYNSLSLLKEPFFLPEGAKEVLLYTCGPTVYDFAHLGNFRTYLFEDLLRRTLEWYGFKVRQVMNLTDVDDKTLRGAIKKGVSLDEFTETYKKAFFEDLKRLHIEPAAAYPEATHYIDAMITMIQKLIDKNHAYVGPDKSVYFRILSFPDYGKLAHLDRAALKVGASGVLVDEYEKETLSDFALWKAYDPERDGNIFWESPFGKGRPGWHIECSAMSLALLGEDRPIDIHCGGEDNKFPHHENEIAQSECCTGKTFARFWLHSAHLLVEGKKMSKSLGNFFTLRDLLERGFTGEEVRFALLQGHYRSQLNFTFEALEAARSSILRLTACVQRLQELEATLPQGSKSYDSAPFLERFGSALADDLALSTALGILFDEVREIHKRADEKRLCLEDVKEALKMFERVDTILGVIAPTLEESPPQEVIDAALARQEARGKKDFLAADKARETITKAGWLVEDTPTGFRLKRKPT